MLTWSIIIHVFKDIPNSLFKNEERKILEVLLKTTLMNSYEGTQLTIAVQCVLKQGTLCHMLHSSEGEYQLRVVQPTLSPFYCHILGGQQSQG